MLWQREQLPPFHSRQAQPHFILSSFLPPGRVGGQKWSREASCRQEIIQAHFASQKVVIFYQPASLVVPILGLQPGVRGLAITQITTQCVMASVSLNCDTKLGYILSLYDPPHPGFSFSKNACLSHHKCKPQHRKTSNYQEKLETTHNRDLSSCVPK